MSTRVGLVRCEHCQRQFNPHSGARHIPWCKKQQSESKRHRLSADKLEALERYRWRISYKPSNSNISSSRSLQNFGQLQSRQHQQILQKLTNQRQQQQQQQQNRTNQAKRSSINSSATLSSPSASSTTSLSNSIASSNNYAAGKQTHARPSRGQSRPGETPAKLKRSVSSVTLTKRHGGVALTIAANSPSGSAMSADSRADTYVASGCSGAPARAKSVSELSNMNELVEMLAKRMEEIYAQNQLLLREIARAGSKPNEHLDSGRRNPRDHEANDEDDDGAEFELCFHCRARCSLEANYCHKCGCKMRPSNPTPSQPD